MTTPAVGAIEVPLRWVDLDAQGHVNNTLVVDYLQEARVSFLLNGPNAHLLGDGIVIVAHQVEYLAQIRFSSEPVLVDLRVGRVGASMFTFGYDLTHDGIQVARARTDMCIFDFELGRPIRMKPEERQRFASQSQELEPFPDLGKWSSGEDAHEYVFGVRWSDLDSYGHVNNTRYFDYVAEARLVLTGELGASTGPERMWLVARQDMSYITQIEHRLQPYVVRTSVVRMGRTSVTHVAEIVDPLSDAVMARAETVMVHAGPDGRPTPIPDAVRAGLGRWPAVAR